MADEQQPRQAALDALRRAIDDETRARDEAARTTADRARDAVWCGASLADLASVTGHSRQAARKRWPGLGDIQRRRTWLGRQTEGVMWAAQQLVAHREALATTATTGFDQALDTLEDVHQRVAAQIPEDATTTASAFWLALDDFVNETLRCCVVLANQPPPETTAAFALHAARSVVGYYDHARQQPDTDAANQHPA